MDLLGRRWAMRILWELRDGPVGARDLLGRIDGLSSSVLYDRLRELVEVDLVTKTDDGYAVTEIGSELGHALAPLQAWAERWADALDR